MTKNKQLKYLFIFFDYISSVFAWSLFFIFRKTYIEKLPFEFTERFYLGLLIIPILWVFSYWIFGTYDDVYRKYRIQTVFKTFTSSLIGATLIFFALILDDTVISYADYYTSFLVLFGIHFFVTLFFRYTLTSITVHKIHAREIGFNTLIIGGNEKALSTYEEITNSHNHGGNIFKGFIKTNGSDNIINTIMPELGSMKDIHLVIQDYDIEEIIIAIETTEHQKLQDILNELEGYQIIIKTIPDMYDILSGKVKTSNLFGTPLMIVKTDIMPNWQKRSKRLMDIFLSVLGLILLTPAFLIIPFLIKKSSKGSVFFSQERIGVHGKPFYIHKFRTMYTDAEKGVPQLSSETDPRITTIGRFLRKTRLDEIPQFYNVLKGDMSVVGPRPERQFFIDQIIKEAPHYKHLHKVKPGITSWGQVKYGYAENVPQMVQRLKYDILYIKNQSLTLDIKILIYTVIIVLKSKGK